MRNDLQGLVWVPGREQRVILVPENASEEELMVIAQVLHEAEHHPYDDVDDGSCGHSLNAAECPVCNFDDEFWAQTEQGVQQ